MPRFNTVTKVFEDIYAKIYTIIDKLETLHKHITENELVILGKDCPEKEQSTFKIINEHADFAQIWKELRKLRLRSDLLYKTIESLHKQFDNYIEDENTTRQRMAD